jgi:general secretion pathway protein H
VSRIGLIKGFTLIELLLVLVIIALASAVAIPNIGSGNQVATLNAAAREIASALRFARGHALTHRKESRFLFDLDSNSYQVTDKDKRYTISKDIAVTLDVAESQLESERQGGVRFFPDGSATGGRITLEIAENKRQLDINWLTGQVELHEF